jgi:D-glycero-alpha-D-manno-heptose 1-phosphate guanylyltransferase
MQAIILAGGFGTRLRSVVADVPKPLAPIGSKPFLDFLIEHLIEQGITHVILSVYHQHELIIDYFEKNPPQIQLSYVIEPRPLGTGGAIRYVFEKESINDNVFILNGDTYLDSNLRLMQQDFTKANSRIMLSAKYKTDCQRYNTLELQGDRITNFNPKGVKESGYINAGVYLASADLFSDIDLNDEFGFEQDFIAKHISDLQPSAYITDGYFIDIGIPEDYERAIQYFSTDAILK